MSKRQLKVGFKALESIICGIMDFMRDGDFRVHNATTEMLETLQDEAAKQGIKLHRMEQEFYDVVRAA
jgi:hypothetical protein